MVGVAPVKLTVFGSANVSICGSLLFARTHTNGMRKNRYHSCGPGGSAVCCVVSTHFMLIPNATVDDDNESQLIDRHDLLISLSSSLLSSTAKWRTLVIDTQMDQTTRVLVAQNWCINLNQYSQNRVRAEHHHQHVMRSIDCNSSNASIFISIIAFARMIIMRCGLKCLIEFCMAVIMHLFERYAVRDA